MIKMGAEQLFGDNRLQRANDEFNECMFELKSTRVMSECETQPAVVSVHVPRDEAISLFLARNPQFTPYRRKIAASARSVYCLHPQKLAAFLG